VSFGLVINIWKSNTKKIVYYPIFILKINVINGHVINNQLGWW